MRKIDQLIQLKPDEDRVTIVREYLITQLPALAIGGLAYFTLLFFLYPIFQFGWLGVMGWLVAFIVVAGWLARRLYSWYYEVVIVTNQRVIDFAQHGFFSKSAREVPWKQVVDVTYSQHGLLATMFHYGSVSIQLDQRQEISLQHVYQPEQLRDILAEYVQALH